MDYEVSHVYLDGKIGEEQEKGIQIAKSLVEKGDTFSLMIDDYSGKHGGEMTLSKQDVMDFYQANSIVIDNVMMESDFTEIAEKIINHPNVKDMIKREGFRKQGKDVFFLKTKEGGIKCKDVFRETSKVKYACPLLSASWHLYRAGVWDGDEFIQKRDIHSILPKEYEEIERMASYIAGLMGCKIHYTFY